VISRSTISKLSAVWDNGQVNEQRSSQRTSFWRSWDVFSGWGLYDFDKDRLDFMTSYSAIFVGDGFAAHKNCRMLRKSGKLLVSSIGL
jgi:hypothetical protein